MSPLIKCLPLVGIILFLLQPAQGFIPIKSPSEFTHRSVASPPSYKEFVHVEERVPDPSLEDGNNVMTIQQQRLNTFLKDEDFQNLKKPAITFEEVHLSPKNNRSSKAFPRSKTNTTGGDEGFRPSEPVLSQGIYGYQSNRRDFGVSVNPILYPYGSPNDIRSGGANTYILPAEDHEENKISSFGVTFDPLTASQVYKENPHPPIQYIVEEDLNEVMDQGAESQGIYTPPKVAHPALLKWTSTTMAPSKVEYAQHIEALQYFPQPNSPPQSPVDLIGPIRKPLSEKVHKKPNFSLLFLGKHGPSFPIFNHMMSDLHGAMERLMGNPLGMFNGNLGSFFTIMRSYLGNGSLGSYGDNRLDVFDFIPLLAVLIAGALIFVGTFPNGINILGINQSTLPLGRTDDESMFDMAFNQLESGVMMISAIRHQDSCSTKLACQLGQAAKDSFPNRDMLLGAINLFLGEKYAGFSQSFEDAMDGRDRSSCEEDCTRCMAI